MKEGKKIRGKREKEPGAKDDKEKEWMKIGETGNGEMASQSIAMYIFYTYIYIVGIVKPEGEKGGRGSYKRDK